MSKHDYRVYFANVSVYVKITKYLTVAKISRSNFSKFMNDDSKYSDTLISLDKLENLRKIIVNSLKDFI